jgi:hypothetical protein
MLKCLKRLGMGSDVLLRGFPISAASAKQAMNQPGSEKQNHQS